MLVVATLQAMPGLDLLGPDWTASKSPVRNLLAGSHVSSTRMPCFHLGTRLQILPMTCSSCTSGRT